MTEQTLFFAAIITIYLYLLMIVWSILKPRQRIWPPGASTWKVLFSWIIFYMGVGLTIILSVIQWNTWFIPSEIRFGVGAPLLTLGGGLAVWGIVTLGVENTHGRKGGFVLQGPYRFTRNPQYLGDIVMLIGVILLVNAIHVTVVSLLMILTFILMPLSEETWLQVQYGKEYLHYKTQTSRFL